MQPNRDMEINFDIFNAPSRPFSTADESAAFLRDARQQFNVLNLSYWFLGASNQMPDRLTW